MERPISPMKMCSKLEVVLCFPLVLECNLNQRFFIARLNPASSFGARTADEGRELSGVSIALCLR